MLDAIRAKLEDRITSASTPELRELAAALLYGYNIGELKVLTDVATGKLLFTLNKVN